MLRPKAFYFFYFAAFAAIMPFLVLYYEQLGFSGRQIGILTALFPLTMLASAPFWSMVADASERHKFVLVSLMLATLVVVFALRTVATFALFCFLIPLFAFFISPVVPLGDSAVLELLGDARRRYGRLRVWGAVGWGLSAPLVGVITERLGIVWAFYAFIALMACCMLVVSGLPIRGIVRAKQKGRLRDFLTAPWLFFLSCVFLGGVGLAVSNNFFLLRLTELGATTTIVGLALTVATVSELPITFLGQQLLERFATSRLLLLALGLLALRLLLYSVFGSPLLVLSVQLLHGFTFSVIWIAGVAYANEYAPAGKRATAQSLFSAVLMGLGSVVGSLSGGFLFDLLGSVGMFATMSVLVLLGAITLFLSLQFATSLKPRTP